MGRGKRQAGKAGTQVGRGASEYELMVRGAMALWDKSDGNDPIWTFSFFGFATVFSFDRRDRVLSVIDDFGLGEVFEKIDLSQIEAEWLEDEEIRDYAAMYSLRKGQLACAMVNDHRLGLYDLRVDVVKDREQTSLDFYEHASSEDLDHNVLDDVLIATWSLDSLNSLDGRPLTLPGGWVVRPDDLQKLLSRTEIVEPFVGLPLSPFIPRYRAWAKAASTTRTRPSSLTS